MDSPAERLEGLVLEGGWKVLKLIERPPGDSGGFFSQRYKIESKDGTRAFLKALDYTEALMSSDDPARVLEALTAAFNYERDLLSHCKQKALDRVVSVIADGKIRVSDTVDGIVQYLIFEEAEGDARSSMDLGHRFDLTLRLRALHHIAVGLKQLHGLAIAHQDLKPSNVLMFNNGSKIGDLGCASRKGSGGPRDHLPVTGDRTYAPPELLYHHVLPDWNVRRLACDVYLLGSMVAYFFTALGMTRIWIPELLPMHRPGMWQGTFEEVLPFVRDAVAKAVDKVKEPIQIQRVQEEIAQIVRELCEPDPLRRGHPKNRSGVPGNEYSLERFITRFDLLARRAATGHFRV
jgi:serine/threonine protein kinase